MTDNGVQLQTAQVYMPTTTPNVRPGFASRTAKFLGISQIVIGAACFIFQIIALQVHAHLAFVSPGIWCGTMFIVAGAFGIAASQHKTNCLITTTMVLCIIVASLLCLPMFVLCLVNTVTYTHEYSSHYLSESRVITTFLIFAIFGTIFAVIFLIMVSLALAFMNDHYYYYGHDEQRHAAGLAMTCILLILDLCEIAASIWSAVICCKAVCCVPGLTGGGATYQVQYVANSGPQNMMVLVPVGGQPGMYMAQSQNQPPTVAGVLGAQNQNQQPPPSYSALSVNQSTNAPLLLNEGADK